ncbi:hypothetical protein LUZ60_000105 [Juncus effusus]|nr:hypothetical protein LUZ60_000105 [Juncus effusus]
MLISFSQNPYSNDGSSSSFGGRRPSSAKSYCKSQSKEQREAQRNLTKVCKEWMKVKEEMGYAKLCGEHLSETVVETDKKITAMLAEFERTDKYVQDLIAQNQQQEYS